MVEPSQADQRRAFLLAAIFERSANGMLVADDRRVYLDANPAVARLLRVSRAEIIGRTIDDFTPPETRAELPARWEAFLAGREIAGEYDLLRGDGTRVCVQFSATPNFLPGRHLSIFMQGVEPLAVDPTPRHGAISPREREVLAMLALGATGREVAERLELSPETVRTHVRNAMEKLGAQTRAHAIVLALRRGEIVLPSAVVDIAMLAQWASPF